MRAILFGLSMLIGMVASAATPSEPQESITTIKSVQIEGATRAAQRGGKCYGLFVGINKYDLTGENAKTYGFARQQTPLSGCVNDAYNMRDTWTDPENGQCQSSDAYIFTDTAATRSAIRARFNAIASAAVSGDTVLYYHSSHGGLFDESTKGACLCTYDDLYLDTEFADDLARFKSGVKVVVVLDTCHSGGMFKAANAWTFAQRVQEMVNECVARSGNGERASASIGWITAADWDESSYDGGTYDSSYGHAGWGGRCTTKLLDGWTKDYADSNGDGIINFQELYVYARDNCAYSSVQSLNESVLQSVVAKGKSESGTYITVDGGSENIRWTYRSGVAQNDSFALGCNGAWTIAVNGSWIQNLTPSSGIGDATVNFHLTANTQAGQRTGTIVITTGSLTLTIVIVQPSQTPVTIVFDGNGGKPAKQTIRQIPGAQWNTVYVEQPSRSGYVFNGWWTSKTGGTEVDVYFGDCDFTANATLYAHWRKQYMVTVNSGDIYLIEGSGDNLKLVHVGSKYMLYNGTIFVIVPQGKPGMAFSHWTCSPDKGNLGSGYSVRDQLNVVEMPESNISFTANYLSTPGYVTIQAVANNPTDNKVSDEDLAAMQKTCEWSVDGKTWSYMEPGRILPVKAGGAIVKFRSTDPRWTLPASQTIFVERDRCLDLFPVATRVPVIDVETSFEDGDAKGSVTISPSMGQVLSGMPVTLTAKPGSNSVFAYWETDDGYIFPSTVKMAPNVDKKVRAVFKLKSSAAIPNISAENLAWSRNSMVGVAFEMLVGVPLAAHPAKFSASGLPPGLKMDAESGIISGIPTKPGIFHAKVTVASVAFPAANNTRTIEIDIRPLPTWAQGTFSGIVYGEYYDEDATEWRMQDGTFGSCTFSATSAGKISGKISQFGTNSTFTAVSYDVDSNTSGNESEWQLLIHGELKSGTNVQDIWLAVQKEAAPDDALANAYSFGIEEKDNYRLMLWRNMWQDKSASYGAERAISAVKGMYTMTLSAGDKYGFGWLSVSIPASGTVKATGKLADGTAVAVSSTLLYDSAFGGYFTLLYNAPSTYKGGSLFLSPVFDPSGDVYSLGASQWTSSNPTATEEYGAGFSRKPSFVGYWYSPNYSLRQLGYDVLSFSTDWPELFASSLKYTYLNDYGIKTTVSIPFWWSPVDTSTQSGNTVYVNLAGNGFITDRTTAPIQYNKQWYYLGGNDGALTITFNPATGVFKGEYTFWYDYWNALDAITQSLSSPVHTSKKVSFEGVFVAGYSLGGFFLWDDTAFYKDAKTGKEKSYKYKQSCRVRLD